MKGRGSTNNHLGGSMARGGGSKNIKGGGPLGFAKPGCISPAPPSGTVAREKMRAGGSHGRVVPESNKTGSGGHPRVPGEKKF